MTARVAASCSFILPGMPITISVLTRAPGVPTGRGERVPPNCPKLHGRGLLGLTVPHKRAYSPDSSLVLDITFLVTDYASGSPELHTGFAWMKNRADKVSQPPTIKLTAGLSKKDSNEQMWIATMECRIVSSDPQLIAHDMGLVLGSYFGKQVTTTKF
jgi:hypothetical protein